ncbi:MULTISPECIES: GerMN domain-containing protein [unclassified Amycolatopsis]|uniref:GerMN domain-containing protein n=1 Tax=unclassified Amycolatopsis TaxID=2618356 RepID=UPI001C6A6010|nr:GerMN domain-containing protein [Amycolatopsis sp. DSM 110486]QYN17946.1 GerMN domain-containing protein [Amycolatopsis sp. DSM 110486]
MIRRATRSFGYVALVLVALAATACGVQPSGAISGDEAPSGPPSTAPGTPAISSIYLVADGAVVRVQRPGLDQTDSALIDALVQGPTSTEKASGFTTEVPQTALPAAVMISASEVTVQLATDVQALSSLAVSQIVCTLHLRDAPDGSVFTLVGGGNVRSGERCG